MAMFRRLIICLFFLIIGSTIFCNAQTSSWLERSWPGRAYLLGNDPETYALVLKITKVKGKNYEGILSAVLTTDTSHSFTTPISGTIYDRYLRIKIEDWPVKCGTCKPQILQFSMESKQFFMKGEAKGCSTVECTWITEFSNKLIDFNEKQEDLLFAMAREERPQPEMEPPTAIEAPQPVVKNENPVIEKPVMPAGDIAISKKEEISYSQSKISENPNLDIQKNKPAEIKLDLPAAGNIIASNKENKTQEITTTLTENPELSVLKNNPPEIRTAILPAGKIIIQTSESKEITAISSSLNRAPAYKIIKDKPIEVRTAILPAGEIVLQPVNNNTPQKINPTLHKKPEYAVIKNTPVEIKTEILPAGEIAKTEKQPDQPSKKEISISATKEITPLEKKDLPEGYVERERRVIKTLVVNTDSITLRVYDNGVVDGDIVSVIYNDNTVINQLSLSSKAFAINIPVKKSGINTIVFHAHNLGEFPPNTALLEIIYGNKKEELTVSSDLTVSSLIDIKYTP